MAIKHRRFTEDKVDFWLPLDRDLHRRIREEAFKHTVSGAYLCEYFIRQGLRRLKLSDRKQRRIWGKKLEEAEEWPEPKK
jgi:hypothetical protein